MRNDRVMKWEKDAKEGIIVAGKDMSKQLKSPCGLIVDQFGQIYVSEWERDRVTRWRQGAEEGSIVGGGYGKGNQSDQLQSPTGLSFDRKGNLYVADCHNHRIQKFEII